MPVTELYAFNLICENLLAALYGVALNQLVSDSETSYEYDLNGNLIRVIGSAQSALYEYNADTSSLRLLFRMAHL